MSIEVHVNGFMMSRVWAMPNKATFSIQPISELLDRWIGDGAVVVDPFAGSSMRGTYRNDIEQSGINSVDWLQGLNVHADVVLFDPPYSPRQISEHYRAAGLHVGTKETQNARLYKAIKIELDRLLKPGGVAICCGWNSAGFGRVRGYEFEEILLVAHGGAHNDTIVTVERKSA